MYIQKNNLRQPVWHEEPCEEGHCFTVTVKMAGGKVLEGRCRKKQHTKREAQEIAAKCLLDQVKETRPQG